MPSVDPEPPSQTNGITFPLVDTPASLRNRAAWESLTVSIATVLIVAAAILGLLSNSLNSTRDNYRHYLISMAQMAAAMVDVTLHDSIRRPEQQNGPEYQRAVEPLRRLQLANPDIHYIYTVVRDGTQVRFVLDAADSAARTHEGLSEQAGLWQSYPDAGPAMLIALGDSNHPGQPAATDIPVQDRWGSFMTGLAPLLDHSGRQFGAVGVDVDSHLYQTRMDATRRAALVGVFPAGALIAVLGFVFFRVRLNGLLAALRLKENETRFRTMFEISPVGIAISRAADGRILQANDALLSMLGYRRDELRVMCFAEIVVPAEANAPAMQPPTTQDQLRSPRESQCLRKDRSQIEALVSGSRIHDAAGNALVCSFVQDISGRKAMEAELAEAARRDKLTELPTRTVFMERLEKALQMQRSGALPVFAVLFLDFDRFKQVNDTLGHNAGDELLRQIARRLQGSLRRTDGLFADVERHLVSRFGGDEFLLLIESLSCNEDAVRFSERLLASLAPAYTIFDSEVNSSASVGIVISRNAESSAEELVRNADLAMYEAKRAGRARSVVFDASMHTRLMRHVTVESSLRRAIGSDEIFLMYQPIVDLYSGRSFAVEALARWNHPTLGSISPLEFIPIAEESRLIIEFGQWALDTACEQMSRWLREDPEHAPQIISVNTSRAEIALGAGLREHLVAVLKRHALPPGCLQLEITEREFMRNPQAALTLLRELHDIGIQLAMDDFGTGTSSLALLRQYPFDTIKIDRSFVRNLESDKKVLAVIHATIQLIENLGMNSLAEGIDKSEQIAVLQSLGCRYAQGFIFSKPVMAYEVLDAIRPRVQRPQSASARAR